MAEPDSCRKSEYGENKEGQEGSTVSTTKTEDAGSDQGDSRGTDKNLLLEGSCQNMGDTEDRDEATATKEQSEVDGSSQSLTTDAGGSDADKTSPEAVKVCECDGEEITDPAKPDDTDGQQAERPAVTEQVDSSDQQQSLGPTEQADAKKQQEPHSTVQDEADKTHNESSANLTNTDIQQDPCQSQAKEDGKDNQQQEPNQQEPSQRISDQVSDDHQGEATGEVSVQDKMDSQEENPAKSDTDQRGSDPSQTEQEGSSDHQDLPNLQEPPQKTAEQTSIENKQETEGDIKEKNEDDSKEHKEETGKETTSESKEKEDSGPEELKETSERKIVDKKDDESSKEATNESKKKEEDGPGELKEMSEGKIGDKGGDGSKEHKEETSKETSESEIKEKKEDDLKELEKESSKETRESKKTDNSEASSVVSNTKTGSTKKSGKNYNAAGNLYDGWGRGASNTFSGDQNLKPSMFQSSRLAAMKWRMSDYDTEMYRAGYPGREDDPKLNRNLLFHQGKIRCEPDGDFIHVIHEEWWGNFELLERHHGYIQWLFPIRESGMNYRAQELQLHEAEAIQADKELQDKVIKSYRMMLVFYGMRLENLETGDVTHTAEAHQRFQHLNFSMHNYLRITRILKCLGEMGLEHYKAPFLRFMLHEAIVTGYLSRTLDSCYNYWIGTVKDDKERENIQDYAELLFRQMQESYENGARDDEQRSKWTCC